MTKPRALAIIWALVVALLLAHNAYLWLGQRIAPDTDILALLPVQERDPILQKSFTQMVDAAQQRVVVLVGAKDWADAKRAADAYTAVLRTRPDLIATMQLNEQNQADWLSKFQQHSLILMSSEQEAQLGNKPAQFWLDAALSKLYSPFGGPKLGAWRDDPFGLFAGWMQERAQETPVRPRDGHLFVANAEKQYVLLPLTLKVPAFSISAQQALLPLLAQAKASALLDVPATEVISAGVILHAAAAGEQASGEVSTIGLGSLLGILVLMWFSFRSFKPIVLVMLSIAIGCLGSISLCWLFFERIHLLTLVFGASLIGVAQDYGLYFLCNRLTADPKLDSSQLLKSLMPGLLLTLLTTVIGYLGLALTPFPGLRQMALFSGLGLVFAWLTVVCWFPVLINAAALKSGALLRSNAALLHHWPLLRWNRASGLGFALFALVVAYGCARLGANDDIRLLQNSPAHLISDQLKLSKLLDAPTPVQFFLVRADTAEGVLQREESLRRKLDPLIAQHTISGYQAISNWVPSAQTQATRRSLLEQKLLGEGMVLSQLATQIGEDASWVSATRSHLLGASELLTPEAFLQTPASEPWRHLWLGQNQGKGEYASIVALRGLSYADLSVLQQAGSGLDGVQWVDKVAEISSVLGRYRAYMGWVVLASYLLVYGLLYPRYRRNTWRVLLPTALASLATLAIFGYAGQNLQLFHVLALMLLLGVGVDYGIFMQEQPDRRDATSWTTVGLSAASTILSFGLLGLSNTPALQAFGLTMLIGTAMVWLIVPIFGKEKTDAKN
ncbi:MMPL family transporter [Undibacterium sp.]|uniref:MMPL family transporter n=1 Tax=Undibacterium sp. TaxID=1914977 RepID=UPI0025CD6391|nr:MMPL family transporter [Undibacterium sp.]